MCLGSSERRELLDIAEPITVASPGVGTSDEDEAYFCEEQLGLEESALLEKLQEEMPLQNLCKTLSILFSYVSTFSYNIIYKKALVIGEPPPHYAK
jgi:hypothetical protein